MGKYRINLIIRSTITFIQNKVLDKLHWIITVPVIERVKGSLVVELTKSANNKVNETLISIFRTNKHKDSIDHPQKNKIDMLTRKESVIRSKEDVKNFISADLALDPKANAYLAEKNY